MNFKLQILGTALLRAKHTVKAHINKKGKIILQKEILKKIIDRDIKIIIEDADKLKPPLKENKYTLTEDHSDFWDLLKNGPKFKGPEGKITREWIHNRGEDDIRYR